jgi:syntaxin-binding protein 5
MNEIRIARTICFSANGHGMYLSSPSELTKFTISSAFRDNIPDMVGALFIAAKELPEPPKPSFLKGLFGGGMSTLDREELFNETNSGKPSKTTARHIPGTVDQFKAQTGSLGAEMARLREVFHLFIYFNNYLRFHFFQQNDCLFIYLLKDSYYNLLLDSLKCERIL